MDSAVSRTVIPKTRLGRTSSTQEVIEARRTLARKTGRIVAVAPPGTRAKRPTAERYVSESISVDGAIAVRTKYKLAIVGLALTASMAFLALMVLAARAG